MQIELAHKFDIREWLFSSYLALGKRAEPLSTDEGARLGWEFAIKMASVREHLLRDKIAHPNAYRQRPFMPSRTESPRSSSNAHNSGTSSTTAVPAGGSRAGANSTYSRLRAAGSSFYATSPFAGEMEDEDDFVLAKAIHEVFGIRGEPVPSLACQHMIDNEDMSLYIPPSDFM